MEDIFCLPDFLLKEYFFNNEYIAFGLKKEV